MAWRYWIIGAVIVSVAVVAALLMIGRLGPTITVRNMSTGTRLARIASGGKVTALAFSPDGQMLGSLIEGKGLKLLSLRDRKFVRVLAGINGKAGKFAFLPGGKLVVSTPDQGEIRINRIFDDRLVRTLQVTDGSITDFAVSRDGKLIATASDEGAVSVVRLADGKLLYSLPGFRPVAFSPRGDLFLSGCQGEGLMLRTAVDGRPVRKLPEYALFAAFSPNSKLLATESQTRAIKLWRIADGRVVRILGDGRTPLVPTSIAFSPDGKLIAVGGLGVTLWKVADGQLSASYSRSDGISFVAISPDGSLLASAEVGLPH